MSESGVFSVEKFSPYVEGSAARRQLFAVKHRLLTMPHRRKPEQNIHIDARFIFDGRQQTRVVKPYLVNTTTEVTNGAFRADIEDWQLRVARSSKDPPEVNAFSYL